MGNRGRSLRGFRLRDNVPVKPRLMDIALQLMDPQSFEDVVYALVRAEEPTAIQLKPPDAGRDTIVPAQGSRGERVWQAKRHTKRIAWSKCEQSLETALAKREPEEVTFVFPINMGEGDECRLKALREKYQGVLILDPWTAGTLREKLNEHPDIRRDHIERPLGIERAFELAALERLAGLKEGWDMQTTAAIDGPIAVLGLDDALTQAEVAVECGDFGNASEQFERMADTALDPMPAVADALRLRAARYAGEARQRARSAELHLQVSRSAARRGDDTAEYAAFRASWELPQAEQWRSSAATARAVWHEHPQEAIPVLRDAFDRSLAGGELGSVAEWAEACCEALAAQEEWQALSDIAKRAVAALGPVQDGGARLAIELDHFDARAACGEDIDHEVHQLLLSPVGRKPQNSAWIYARLGAVHARNGNSTDAVLCFAKAAQLWRVAGDAEEEIAEAIFSQDAVGQLLPDAHPLDQTERIAAADLRGRVLTPAVRADRKETEGLRAWLDGRGPDALRALMISRSIHRRAGHFGGCARAGTALRALCESIEEWPEALSWAIRTANHDAARKAALQLSWPEVKERLRVDGSPWERGPSFEAIAAAGALASNRDISALIATLLEAASDHTGEQYMQVHPAPAARRALSTVLCGIDQQHLPRALDEVAYEIEHTPFPPSEATQGLLLAVDAGLSANFTLIAEVACEFSPAHVRSVDHALPLIERSPEALELVKERAENGFTALVLAARLELPDTCQTLEAKASDITARSLSDSLAPEETLTNKDRGLLARWSTPEQQAAVAHDLIGILADSSDLDVHRYEAGNGLQTLASRLDPAVASAVLDELLTVSAQVAMPSTTTGLRSHPNEHLARMIFRAPAAGAYVRAAALHAAYSLAAQCSRAPELRDALDQALEDTDSILRGTAVQIVQAHPEGTDIDLDGMLNDADLSVSTAAFAECVRRGTISAEHPLVSTLVDADQPLAVRCSILSVARRSPQDYGAALEQLTEDPHVYVRAAARGALGN